MLIPALGRGGSKRSGNDPETPLHGLTCYSTELITLRFVSEQEFWCQRSALWSSQSRLKMGQVKSLSLLMKSLSIGPHTCTVSITTAEHGGKSRSTRQMQRSNIVTTIRRAANALSARLHTYLYEDYVWKFRPHLCIYAWFSVFVSTPGNDFLITAVNASVQQSDTLWINVLLLHSLYLLDLLMSTPALIALVNSLNCVFSHIWYLLICCIFINLFSDCSFKLMGAVLAEGRVLISMTQFQ